MDSLDGVLALECLTLASDEPSPYVLSWALDPSSDDLAECTVMVIMRRAHGLLLAVPPGFLPADVLQQGNLGDQDQVFGPSQEFTVPAMISDGGVLSTTGEELSVLVVDCSEDVMPYLREFRESEEVIFSFDEDAPFSFPAIDALLPLVRNWVASTSEQLAAFYTPDEADAGLENSPMAKRASRKGHAFRRWAKAKEGDYSCPVEPVAGGHECPASVDPTREDLGRSSISLRAADAYPWKIHCSGGSAALGCSSGSAQRSFVFSSKGYPSSTKNHDKAVPWFVGFSIKPETYGTSSNGTRKGGPCTVVWPDFRRCSGTGSFDAVPGAHEFGVADSPVTRGPYGRTDGHQQCRGSWRYWTCKASGRIGYAQGALFPGCDTKYGQEDVPYNSIRYSSCGDVGAWNIGSQVPGALWWLWQTSRTGATYVPGHDCLRLHDGWSDGGGHGYGGLACGQHRTSKPGWRPDGLGQSTLPPGGCPSFHIHVPPDHHRLKDKGVRTAGRSKMGDLCLSIPQRDGGHSSEETGIGEPEQAFRAFVRGHHSKTKAQGKTRAEAKRGRQRPDPSERGDGGLDDFENPQSRPQGGQESSPFEDTTTFDAWAICLPRLFLRCRTSFGWHLKRSFTACWRDQPVASTTSFPLPVPHPGCFDGSGPGLSKKRLAVVARRRLLHCIVYCLNYMFLGRHPTLDEIRRCPNAVQRRCFQRLRSLLDVWSSPGGIFHDTWTLRP